MGQYPSNPIGEPGSEDLKKNFLKVHKPEREVRWILDQSAVSDALMVQADEMMKAEGIREEDEMFDLQGGDSASDILHAPSVASNIFSDFTTATGATLPMGNVNKYRPRADAANSMNPFGDESDECDVFAKPLNENYSVAQTQLYDLPTAERKEGIFNRYSKWMTACSTPKGELQLKREQYMSVLHLKMKANLGFYYLDRFLPMFPQFSKLQPKVQTGLSQHDSNQEPSTGGLTFSGGSSSRPLKAVVQAITNTVFMDLAFTGSLGLVKRDSSTKATASGSYRKSPDHYIVLLNRRSGVPIAMCAKKVDASGAPPIVRIYATKRRVFGQRPAASTDQLGLDWGGSLPLYPWAEIVTVSMFPRPLKFHIYMSSGSDGCFFPQPSFEAILSHGQEPIITVAGRTDAERQVSGSALISLEVTKDENGKNGVFFNIDVAQGIDPSLVMCFTAVIDEVVEKSMSLQCQAASLVARNRPHQ
eukprot:scaffold2816_cov121-Cylindrotheca_fusiformis.AAC.19